MSVRSLVTFVAASAIVVTLALLLRPRPTMAASDGATANDARSADSANAQERRTVIFAGGCFWCMEPPFEKVPGVYAVRSGYTSGRVSNPTYEQVSAGGTGHTEAVEIEFDPRRVTYEQLLDLFWHNIDPLTANAQFCDHGPQYRSGIYPKNAEERAAAEASKAAIARKLGKPVVTEIVDATEFYVAEGYHQDYYKKNPVRYTFYRNACGRDRRLRDLWGEAAGVGTLGLGRATGT
jgi:peptide-methionine (S)-S-oxide reductase